MYAVLPILGETKNLGGFVCCYCLVISFYGGVFAVLPAYTADLFGTKVSYTYIDT